MQQAKFCNTTQHNAIPYNTTSSVTSFSLKMKPKKQGPANFQILIDKLGLVLVQLVPPHPTTSRKSEPPSLKTEHPSNQSNLPPR